MPLDVLGITWYSHILIEQSDSMGDMGNIIFRKFTFLST